MRRYRGAHNMKLYFQTKESLVAALEAQRPLCVQKDADAITEHAFAEKAYRDEWRRACREAAKWTYEELKDNNFQLPFDKGYRGRPTCPTPLVQMLDQALFYLARTEQKKWTVDDGYNTNHSGMFRILTLDAPTVKAVC